MLARVVCLDANLLIIYNNYVLYWVFINKPSGKLGRALQHIANKSIKVRSTKGISRLYTRPEAFYELNPFSGSKCCVRNEWLFIVRAQSRMILWNCSGGNDRVSFPIICGWTSFNFCDYFSQEQATFIYETKKFVLSCKGVKWSFYHNFTKQLKKCN